MRKLETHMECAKRLETMLLYCRLIAISAPTYADNISRSDKYLQYRTSITRIAILS